jgi:hypothetical protein
MIKDHWVLASKWLVGTSASLLAGIFSAGMDDILHEVAVILGILVSVLTLLNLMWSLTDKIHGNNRRNKL